MRSKWKGDFIYKCIQKSDVIIVSRDLKIVPRFIGKLFKIYNGKRAYIQKISQYMVGFRFGAFNLCRKITNKIHLKIKGKDKKKNKR